MRFNGKDIRHVHRAISIAKEIPPGMPNREIATIETARGDEVSAVDVLQDTYRVRVNIAARSLEEAWRVRELLAEWAMSSGKQTAELEPTRAPGKAYDAIVKSISRPEFVFGFATVDVDFLLPRPVMHEMIEKTANGNSTNEITFRVGGSVSVQPAFSIVANAAANGLTLSMDGKQFLKLNRRIKAGETVEVLLKTSAVLVNGEHAEEDIVYTETDMDVELEPGAHKLQSSVAGALKARWRNEWA